MIRVVSARARVHAAAQHRRFSKNGRARPGNFLLFLPLSLSLSLSLAFFFVFFLSFFLSFFDKVTDLPCTINISPSPSVRLILRRIYRIMIYPALGWNDGLIRRRENIRPHISGRAQLPLLGARIMRTPSASFSCECMNAGEYTSHVPTYVTPTSKVSGESVGSRGLEHTR